MSHAIEFEIVQGDIAAFEADVIVLKYAQAFYGADKFVASLLRPEGPRSNELRPAAGEYRLVRTDGHTQATQALFVGVVPLRYFRYGQIQEMGYLALNILSKEIPDAKHIAMTIHGAAVGLDEVEALLAQFKGCILALQAGNAPQTLERLTVVERVEDRVSRLRHALDEYLAKEDYAARIPGRWAYRLTFDTEEIAPPAAPVRKAQEAPKPAAEQKVPAPTPTKPEEPAAAPRTEKPHAFIAMPFSEDMDDVFYYGIQNPVHNCGLLCERVDKSAFTGDIMGYVRQRIETSSVVIAELTGANPNVYLEVGYAWGKERPTILLVQSEQQLEFDVRGHKCLTYRKIKDLEQSLQKEIQGMITAGIITF